MGMVAAPVSADIEALDYYTRCLEIWEFPKISGYLRVFLKGYYKGTIRVPLKSSKDPTI